MIMVAAKRRGKRKILAGPVSVVSNIIHGMRTTPIAMTP
jgi:hypothetical protein